MRISYRARMGYPGKLTDAARRECNTCRYVYIPARGVECWQIPSGTPVSQLPGHWTCPECDGKRDGFMLIED
jgi:rubredoxin